MQPIWWCGPLADDEGQMMLLGAVVLVVGFLILTGITARVSQIAQETTQGTGNLLSEAAALQTGFKASGTSPLLDAGGGTAQQVHAARLLLERGFVLTFDCTNDRFTLANEDSQVTVTITTP